MFSLRTLRILFVVDLINMANEAAWLTGAREKPFHVAKAPMPSPGPSEMVIRNRATASEQSRLCQAVTRPLIISLI